ncbi:MAG: site-specific DNA-methyltransferase [Acidobacteriota bacterium]|nr:site-specific DNA-methyltransferase [Acidobacteriota bacterium]
MPRPYINRILCGDAALVLKQLPDNSVDCVVTSPPYWSLRDYGVRGQLGLERSFEEYLQKLLVVFDEARRVLKREGTCWVVMGDTYMGDAPVRKKTSEQAEALPPEARRRGAVAAGGLKKKCLVQTPARLAIMMTERGWLLRNEIIWYKPNCMPSSVRDRFTVDFEKIFFFVKSQTYYFRQQFEPLKDAGRLRRPLLGQSGTRKRRYRDPYIAAINPDTAAASSLRMLRTGRNKRCVWRIAPRPYLGNHFAVYPPALIETPIKAGCPEEGIVLDPFMGSGTTALVAHRLGRKFVGIELNPRYVRLAQRRLVEDGHHLPLLNSANCTR